MDSWAPWEGAPVCAFFVACGHLLRDARREFFEVVAEVHFVSKGSGDGHDRI